MVLEFSPLRGTMSEVYTSEYFMEKLGEMRENVAKAKKGYKVINELMSSKDNSIQVVKAKDMERSQ